MLGELLVCTSELFTDGLGQRLIEDEVADAASPCREVAAVVNVETLKDRGDLRPEPGLIEPVFVRNRRDGEAGRYVNPVLSERADHLTQGCVLTAHQTDVVGGDLVKPTNVVPIRAGLRSLRHHPSSGLTGLSMPNAQSRG